MNSRPPYGYCWLPGGLQQDVEKNHPDRAALVRIGDLGEVYRIASRLSSGLHRDALEAIPEYGRDWATWFTAIARPLIRISRPDNRAGSAGFPRRYSSRARLCPDNECISVQIRDLPVILFRR